jgi:hypothetical protein
MPDQLRPEKSYSQSSYRPLGMTLVDAGLIHLAQLQVALEDQKAYVNFRLGEILALRGWLKQETADFFAQEWNTLLQNQEKKRLGAYLQAAGLLDAEQVNSILKEHIRLGVKFGSIAVLKGYISEQTLNFFLRNIDAKALEKSAFVETPKPENSDLPHDNPNPHQATQSQYSFWKNLDQSLDQDDIEEIPWVG